jgi:hypothetical protein
MPALDRLAYSGVCRPPRRRRQAWGMRALVLMAALATVAVLAAALRVFL